MPDFKVAPTVNGVGLVRVDGSTPLTANWDLSTGRKILADTFSARSASGLRLEDDGGNLGVFVQDGGFVGIGTASPSQMLSMVEGAIRISRDSSGGPGYFEFEETQAGGKIGKFDMAAGVMRFGQRFVSNIVLIDLTSKIVTFSNGINLGNTTLSDYAQDVVAWTPALSSSPSGFSSSYTTRTFGYTRIGNLVFFHVRMTMSSPTGGGSNQLQVNLPIAGKSGVVQVVNGMYSNATTGISPMEGLISGTNQALLYGTAAAIIGTSFATGYTAYLAGVYMV